jgi:hypothetical protein
MIDSGSHSAIYSSNNSLHLLLSNNSPETFSVQPVARRVQCWCVGIGNTVAVWCTNKRSARNSGVVLWVCYVSNTTNKYVGMHAPSFSRTHTRTYTHTHTHNCCAPKSTSNVRPPTVGRPLQPGRVPRHHLPPATSHAAGLLPLGCACRTASQAPFSRLQMHPIRRMHHVHHVHRLPNAFSVWVWVWWCNQCNGVCQRQANGREACK